MPLPPNGGRKEEKGRPNWGSRRVQEGEAPSAGLCPRRRRRRGGLAIQGQAPGKIVSVRLPEWLMAPLCYLIASDA